jgi:type I restriction enzyme S subunit
VDRPQQDQDRLRNPAQPLEALLPLRRDRRASQLAWRAIRVSNPPEIKASGGRWRADIVARLARAAGGDVVVAKITPCFENGKGALAHGLKNGVGFGTTELHVLRAGGRLDAGFLFYLTISHTFRALGESEMYGAGGQKRVPPEFAKDFRVPLPSLSEQRDIARFLDAKTAQIDMLLARKRQLIDKLKEERSALISRTVTRGLPAAVAKAKGVPPNPKTRDSGVEWLGDIPAHWRPMRAKHLCSAIVDCKNRTPEYFDDGEYLVARTTDVRDGAISFETMYRTDEENFREWTARGAPSRQDVLFTREAPAGEAALFDGSRPMCLGQRMMYFRTNPTLLNPRFLVNWVYGSAARGYIASLSGGSTVTHLRVGQVLDFPIATPPIAEQVAIADFLGERTLELDALTSTALQVIERLIEYRQALIAAAVTGKVDVRDLA